MTTYLNWTCTECKTVNYITMKQKEEIIKKLDPKYPAQTEVIQCSNCRSQVSLQAHYPPSSADLDAVEKERKIKRDTRRV